MKRIVGLLAAALLLAGCSSGAGGSAPKPTTALATTDSAPSTSPTTTPPPVTSSAPEVLALGQPYDTAYFTTTVYAVDPNAAPDAPPPQSADAKWAAADIEVCVKQGGTIGMTPWSLVGADNGRYEVSSTGYSQFPTPAYPFGEAQLAAGECVRGWLVFVMPQSGTIAFVRYAPSISGVDPARWAAS